MSGVGDLLKIIIIIINPKSGKKKFVCKIRNAKNDFCYLYGRLRLGVFKQAQKMLLM